MRRTRQFALAIFTVIGGALLAEAQPQPPGTGAPPPPPPPGAPGAAAPGAVPPNPGTAGIPNPNAPAPGVIPPGPGNPGGAGTVAPPAGELKTIRGTVKEFTKADRGEVDGLILSEGTVIHWPPHMADRFTAAAAKGDQVRVTGFEMTGPANDKKIEVSTLTNLTTNKTVENPDRPAPAAKANGKAGDLEERIVALEQKIDRLTREIETLKTRK